jgi:hypothetical protein
VRRYPTRVQDGRVHLSPAIDAEREAAGRPPPRRPRPGPPPRRDGPRPP